MCIVIGGRLSKVFNVILTFTWADAGIDRNNISIPYRKLKNCFPIIECWPFVVLDEMGKKYGTPPSTIPTTKPVFHRAVNLNSK